MLLLSLKIKLSLAQNNSHTTKGHPGVTSSEPPECERKAQTQGSQVTTLDPRPQRQAFQVSAPSDAQFPIGSKDVHDKSSTSGHRTGN